MEKSGGLAADIARPRKLKSDTQSCYGRQRALGTVGGAAVGGIIDHEVTKSK